MFATWPTGSNESAGKRKGGRIRRGNAWVRQLLREFAKATVHAAKL